MSPWARLVLLVPLLVCLLSTAPAVAAAPAFDPATPADPPVLRTGVVTPMILSAGGTRFFVLSGTSGGWVSLELATGDVTLKLQDAANTASLQQSSQGPSAGWLEVRPETCRGGGGGVPPERRLSSPAVAPGDRLRAANGFPAELLGLSGSDSPSTYRLQLASHGGAHLAVTFFPQAAGEGWAQPASEVTSSAFSSSGSSASSSISNSTSGSSSSVVTVG